MFWISKSVEAVDGVATVSKSNVSAGSYDVRICGDVLDVVLLVDPESTDSTGTIQTSRVTDCRSAT